MDWVTHRGPFQPLPICDSVISPREATFFIADLSKARRQQQEAGSPPAPDVAGFSESQPSSQRSTHSISEVETPSIQQATAREKSGEAADGDGCATSHQLGRESKEPRTKRVFSTSSMRLYGDPQPALASADRLHAVLQNPEKSRAAFWLPHIDPATRNMFPGHRMHLLNTLSIMFPFFPTSTVRKPLQGTTQTPSSFPLFPGV